MRVIEGPRAIDECDQSWAVLADRLDLPVFQRPEWARTWIEHLGRDAVPWILVCDGPSPFVWPLVTTRYGPYRVLRSLGEGVSDYLGPIGPHPADAVRQAIESLSQRTSTWGHIGLKSLFVPNEALEILRSGLRGFSSRPYERCPFIHAEGTFEAYLEGQKKKFRANWKRTIRRTESHGKVETKIESFSERLFAEIESVERDSWKWSAGSAYLSNPDRRAFLRSVLAQPSMRSEIWTCRIDGDLAAFAVAFTSRASRHYYLPSFRDRYSDVGTYLLGKIAEATFSSEFTELDLLQGDEAYKLAWATGERTVYEIAATGRSAMGWPAVQALRGRWRLSESPRTHALRARIQGALHRLRRSDALD